jgi:xanthine/CO dehydrogenase XdhC/CoxF family maturation factor
LPLGSRLALRDGGELLSTIPNQEMATELTLAARSALRGPGTRSRNIHGRGFEALLEVIEPAPHLFLFGSGPDAVPVVEFARALGLGVTVCDTTARVTTRERFSGLATLHMGSIASILPEINARLTPLAVVMSHHYPTDASALEMLLGSRVQYLGMLGPARRTARMLSELAPGKAALIARDARLRAPIGLDLGAETPAQIALSIVAEIQAVLARASSESLSRRGLRPIHAPGLELSLAPVERWARTGST